MAKKSTAERGTGQPQIEEQHFLPADAKPISPQERIELRTFFEGQLWQKALFNARQCRPPEFPNFPAGCTDEMRRQLMGEQLCRMQGWKMFESALAVQTKTPEQRRVTAPDNYPDAGRIEAQAGPPPQSPSAAHLPPPASTKADKRPSP